MTPQQALQLAQAEVASIPDGAIHYRQAGEASSVTHVLLHGIGSSSASWAYQLAACQTSDTHRVLAWDAPGYGASTPVSPPQPQAHDYAVRLWQWLDALRVQTPLTLVGHSLGALMAARAAVMHPQRVQHLVLLAPARGYGQANEAEREQVRHTRLDNLQRLGPHGMADARAAAMLSPNARSDWVEAVRENMSQIRPDGYTQAVHLLAQGRLTEDVAAWRGRLTVASGDADTITPVQACDAVAQAGGVPRISLGAVGHACPFEAAPAVHALLGLPTIHP